MQNVVNRIATLLAGRRPEFQTVTLGTDGGTPPKSRKVTPLSNQSGRILLDSPRSRLLVDCREDMSRFSGRATITTLDNTGTLTATVNGTDYTFAGGGTETAAEMLVGLRNSINTGLDLGALTLTFSASPKTITRSAGSWITDGVQVGAKIDVTGSANNDGTTFLVLGVTATVLTVYEAPTTEAAVAVTAVVVSQQVNATVEDRDGDGSSETLVVRVELGDDIHADTPLRAAAYAQPEEDFSFSVAYSGTGVVAYEVDASRATFTVFAVADGTGAGKPPDTAWRRIAGPYKADWRGADKVFDSGGQERYDIRVQYTDGIVARAALGPSIMENKA